MTARSYDVRVVALTVDATPKWIDNLLSHHEVPGCFGGRQGVSRRINDIGVLAIAIVRMLVDEVGLPVGRAVALVQDSATEKSIGPLRTPSGLRIEIPEALTRELQERLRDALLAAPRPSRGRPAADAR